MKSFRVTLIVTILLVNVLSHSYNQLDSSQEQNNFIFQDQTVFESGNNSSGNNSGGGSTNSTTSDAHCLVLSNFTISQSNYASVHLVNTCNTSINYPGINASSDHSGVSGLYDTWWYVLGGGNGSGNQSSAYPYYQMGWQLSFNQSIANGTLINLTFQATVLNCGPNNSWSNACPNSNNSIITYQLQYITPIARLSISSASINTNNDRISLRYLSENYSGYVSWVYTTANGTSTITSYTNTVNRTTYIYPDIFGVIQICGTIPGDTTCINITRSVRPLYGSILAPVNNLTTNDSGIYVSYFAENYSYGILEINNQTFHYVQSSNSSSNSNNTAFVQLPAGWSAICLRLTGDNNTSQMDCVNVYKTPPIVRLVITSANLSGNNNAIDVSYRTENFSGTVHWYYNTSNGTSHTTSYGNSYQRTASLYPNTFGLIQVCGTIDNGSKYECVSIMRAARMLEGNLISPGNNSQVSTSNSEVVYTANNYTNGSISVNGIVYRTLDSEFDANWNNTSGSTSVYFGYGMSTICLNLWGENGAYISDCVVVERVVPTHTVSITYPANGTTFSGQHIDVSYVLVNSSGHYFTVNGATIQPTNNTTGTNIRLTVGYGAQYVCLVSYDAAGNATNDCVQVNMLNPNADSDADGIPDQSDSCPNTNSGLTVNSSGCATNQLDTDADGVDDSADLCPNTQQFTSVNNVGCASYQRDSDGDGVMDNIDLCNATATNTVVDSNGCSPSQLDSDNDGMNDDVDICPATIAGSQVNAVGCSSSQRDTDSDGIVDSFDQCPYTILGTVVDQTGCDFNNSSGGSSGNSSSLPEDPGLPGFEATLAMVSICVAFMVGLRHRESEN
tara:strand:+ start:391 stop:2922 length:2532 start_codon:yes stop_codon:yes gene_type:complete